MNLKIRTGFISTYLLIMALSVGLLTAYVTSNNFLLTRVLAEANQVSNDQLEDSHLLYIKDKIKYGLGIPPFIFNHDLNGLKRLGDNYVGGDGDNKYRLGDNYVGGDGNNKYK